MKSLLIATAALSLLAGPALAQTPTNVPLTGNVAGQCGGGAGIGGPSILTIPDMTGSDGRLLSTTYPMAFPGIWCNGPATVLMGATQILQLGSGGDPNGISDPVPSGAPFVNVVDMTITGGPFSHFLGGPLVSSDLTVFAGTGTGTPPHSVTTTQAFDLPASTSTIALSLPNTAAATDRPIAGDYLGVIVLITTPAP